MTTAPHGASVELRFHAELNDHLPPFRRERAFRRESFLNPTVKDLIEAQGVPHCEVDRILVNGQAVDFSYRVHADDRIEVFPLSVGTDVAGAANLLPAPPEPRRFIVDANMGKLAKRLRMLGFDTLYRADFDDAEIVAIAAAEGRIILTRDRHLLRRGAVRHGYWVRANHPSTQLEETIARFALRERIDPFSRCSVCNGVVAEADPASIQAWVPAAVYARYATFFRCAGCGRVYWEGSHFDGLQVWMADCLD